MLLSTITRSSCSSLPYSVPPLPVKMDELPRSCAPHAPPNLLVQYHPQENYC